MKFKGNTDKKQKKRDKKKSALYHKINYNDDFNYNKNQKTPTTIHINGKSNAHYKTKAFNLTLQNSINQLKNRNKINEKKNIKEISKNIEILFSKIDI